MPVGDGALWALRMPAGHGGDRCGCKNTFICWNGRFVSFIYSIDIMYMQC